MIKIIFLLFSLVFYNCAIANVTIAKNCYIQTKPTELKNSSSILTIYVYFDNELNNEVGSLAEYNYSRKFIQLQLAKNPQEAQNRKDFEDGALEEFVDKIRYEYFEDKKSGIYYFVKAGHGSRFGELVKYKNLKTKKEIVFQLVDCKLDR